MSNSVTVWQPPSEEFSTFALAVDNPSGQETMEQIQYEARLLRRLSELVEEDPREATELLTDSPEYNPDLYAIGEGSQPEDYPSLILACDQMQMLLNRIDWSAAGENQTLDRSDLPSLREIIESIPS